LPPNPDLHPSYHIYANGFSQYCTYVSQHISRTRALLPRSRVLTQHIITILWLDAFQAGRGGDFDGDDNGNNNHKTQWLVALLQVWMMVMRKHPQVVRNPKVHQILSTQVGEELIPPIRLPKYHPPNCHQYPVVDSLSDGGQAPPMMAGTPWDDRRSHGWLATTREEDGSGMSLCGTLQYKISQGGKKNSILGLCGTTKGRTTYCVAK